MKKAFQIFLLVSVGSVIYGMYRKAMNERKEIKIKK